MRCFWSAVVAAAVAMTGKGASAQADEELKPGDAAPEFSLPGSDGETYTLADFRGEKVVVIAWYPKAFTGG